MTFLQWEMLPYASSALLGEQYGPLEVTSIWTRAKAPLTQEVKFMPW